MSHRKPLGKDWLESGVVMLLGGYQINPLFN
jgi:hypothetical protein